MNKVECLRCTLCSYCGIVYSCEKRVKRVKTMELTQSKNLSNDICPVARTAEIVSGKWTLLIIRDLTSGVKRFHQLQQSLQGISPKTLSERLRTLEGEGVIVRKTFAEMPPRVEYSLTEKGHDLLPVIESMRTYGKRWLCNE